MLRSASNCNTTFVMTLAMKNGHEHGTWNVGGACIHLAHPKYNHKRISSREKAKYFSGITVGRMRWAWWWISMDTSWLTQKLRSVMSSTSPDLHKFELGIYMLNGICIYTRQFSWNSNPSTMEPDQSQHNPTQPIVLLPSSYLSPPSSHCVFITAREKSGVHLKNVGISNFFALFLQFHSTELHKMRQCQQRIIFFFFGKERKTRFFPLNLVLKYVRSL